MVMLVKMVMVVMFTIDVNSCEDTNGVNRDSEVQW